LAERAGHPLAIFRVQGDPEAVSASSMLFRISVNLSAPARRHDTSRHDLRHPLIFEHGRAAF
jgi:hypothetical protein